MSRENTNREPYQQAYYPPSPTPLTLYMRTSIVWQTLRFFVINLKILLLMSKSHH
ncbi:hypothetical protein [Rhodocyclus tenuis]|uniref:Uncharacterized protein n=1 Tax=Rhodocyclus tenuis TaxID=1066 RepID=A0A840GAN4_RHOTE|nr:hypothetical protein [Rhodocyclus tenuis]MBB4247728.1 hypothetical protein [Rhodocyclus tenuis]